MWAIILIVIVVLLAIWWFMTQNQKPAEPAKTGLLSTPIEYALERCARSGRRSHARLNSVGVVGLGRPRFWRWLRAPLREAAARSQVGVICVIALSAIAAGCSSRPTAPSSLDRARLTRARSTYSSRQRARLWPEPPGVMFGGSRGRGLDFADIVVSIPPAGARQPGDVTLPSSLPANPERDFTILRADRMDLAQAKANFDARIRRIPGRRVLIFVHGFNTRFEEAVYRFAQIVHDARVDVAPVLFTWPSGGNVTDYVYDRDSAVYSRDAFEAVLQALVKDPNVDSISILAHSMGNYLAVESLRQMSIRDRGLSPKIRDVMLASPDIDVDVFRRQIAEIDAGPRPAQFTLFISRDDRALGLSSFLARNSTRLGALDPAKEPYRSILEQGRVQVIDLTGMASGDFTNHGKFASGEVVGAIGQRLAEGQSLSDAKGGLIESLGTFTGGAINVAAGVATGAVAAPSEVFDPTKRERSVDTAAQATILEPVTAPADKALPIPVEPRGELTVRVAAMPADTNANGDIFGGWVLSQMDAAGGIASAEYAKGRVVTIAIDAMTFIRPVKVGDVLCVYTAIDGVGRTSMKVHVEAWARRRRTHDREKVTDATFTFVAIDEDGRPRPVTAGQAEGEI